MRQIFQRLALVFFCIYLAVLPGSTIVVAFDRVPSWGTWMGGALLLLQGVAALCWLVGRHGARGGLAALLVFLLAWLVEYIGVTTGALFGRYQYTAALQPQLFGTVPLAIPCAWLMVAAGAWQLANVDERRPTADHRVLPMLVARRSSLVVAATLVLLLDLQIETVATKINQYWIWHEGGPYYGVPTANFVAWWLAGLAMAVVVAVVLPQSGGERTSERGNLETTGDTSRLTSHSPWLAHRAARQLPAALYLLSTLMFAIVNISRGYTIAGLVGLLVLVVVVARAAWPASAQTALLAGVDPANPAD